MRETERRIRLYQARLPKIKEKLLATLLVFAISIATMAVATFSWLTLSISPQVSGISTNIAANGNLEIALVNGDGSTPPASSAIGDSLLSVVERNKTWGNLINLSDSEAYGLDKIVLRPASLNPLTLIDKPLSAATYTTDGRVQLLDSNFNYTVYDNTLGFTQSSNKGVRAISSVVYDDISYDNPDAVEYAQRMSEIEIGFTNVLRAFNNLSNEMDSIAGLIGTYMNSILRDTASEEPCDPTDVYNFYQLLCKMDEDVVEPVGEYFMQMFAMYQEHTDELLFLTGNNAGLSVNYTPVKFESLDDFCAGAVAELAVMNRVRTDPNVGQSAIVFSSLSQYIADRATLKADIAKLEPDAVSYDAGVPVTRTWGYIEPIADHMIKISTVTLNGSDMGDWFGGLPGNVMALLDILGNSASQNNVVIHDGMLERFDKLLHNGLGFRVSQMTIYFSKQALQDKAADYIGGLGSWVAGRLNDHVKANIRTDAVSEMPTSTSKADIDEANEILGSKITSYTYSAKDTYGLVLDFWIRTNNPSSVLILEGDVIEGDPEPVSEKVEYVVYDSDGVATFYEIESTPIYVTSVITTTVKDYNADSGKEDVTSTVTGDPEEIFKVGSGETATWYYKKNGEKIPLGETETPIMDGEVQIGTETVTVSFAQENPPQKTKTKVIGYSGANRIWTEDKIDPDTASQSTTQGSGSCYIFYSNDEIEMAQSLELIAAMKVAFIDAEEGILLANAHFDVENKYSEYGRTIVPMYLDNDSNKISIPGVDGATYTDIHYITPLVKNDPHMITAIVYLDGTQITNDKVLAASEIEGSLNIQFGSYTAPTAMSDEKLIASTRSVTAELVGSYDYMLGDGREHKVTVRLNVEGTEPTEIEGNFIRRISETQGTRQDAFEFEYKGDGIWEGEYTFDVPGDFILRTVTIDGIEYILNQTTLPEVNIDGFALESVSGQYALRYVHRTADSYKTERFSIVVAAVEGAYPTRVQGVFMGDGNIGNIITDYTGSGAYWEADVSFTKSGTYTMTSVIIDGQPYNVATPIVREVYTGLYTRVSIIPVDVEDYTDEELDGRELITANGIQYFYAGIPHEFDVSVEIFDDTGKELPGLGNVKLYYKGSAYDLDADLSWDQEAGCYGGESFLVEDPGVFSFDYVSVSGERIAKAEGAATITAAPKDPVSYLGIRDAIDDYVVQLNSSVAAEEITLAFRNAQAASVYGLFKRVTKTADTNADVVSYVIMMARNNGDSTHTFAIPAQDGRWTLLDVKVMNVYEEESGIFYTGNPDAEWPEAPSEIITVTNANTAWYDLDNITNGEGAVVEDHYYDIDLADVSDLTYKNEVEETKVVANITVSRPNIKTQTFNGTFLQSHSLSGLAATFTDFEGQPIGEEFVINNVRLVVTYNKNTSEGKGGYTGVPDSYTGFTLDLSPDSTNKTFTQTAAQSLVYAGTYSATFYYSVGDTERSETGITYTVASPTPTVEISGVDPDTSTELDVHVGNDVVNPLKNSWTDTSATVYIYCEDIKGEGCEEVQYEYKPTALSIQMTNFGNATDATLKFTANSGGVPRIYKNYGNTNGSWDADTYNQTDSYTWTADGDTTYYIGSVGGAYGSNIFSGDTGCDSKTAAGTLTSATTLTLTGTVNGQTQTFTVTLATPITITNDY